MPLMLDVRVGETVTIVSEKAITAKIVIKEKSGQRARLSIDTDYSGARISVTRPINMASKGISKELLKEA